MRYWPSPSVTAVRTFSISAGLAASTVTPGRTAPDESFTVPAIDPCANTAAGKQMSARAYAALASTRLPKRNLPVLAALEWRMEPVDPVVVGTPEDPLRYRGGLLTEL